MSYLVSQRTREIGVRLALWLTRAMQSLLFSASTTDAGTFVAVPLLMILTAAVACYVPARRAMRIDPVIALRTD